MKKFVLSAAAVSLLCLSSAGHARDLSRGTVEIGGDLDLSTMSIDNKPEWGDSFKSDTKHLSTDLVYYVADNFGMGLQWNYVRTELDIFGDTLESTTNMIGPTAAYNISLNDDTSLKLLGGIFITSSEESDSSGTESGDGNGWHVGGQLNYFLNDAVAINGLLSYFSLSLKDDATFTNFDSDGWGLGIGLSVYLQ